MNSQQQPIERDGPNRNCPACREQRMHTEAEWRFHPYRGHGFDGTKWTHPDLAEEAAKKAKAGS